MLGDNALSVASYAGSWMKVVQICVEINWKMLIRCDEFVLLFRYEMCFNWKTISFSTNFSFFFFCKFWTLTQIKLDSHQFVRWNCVISQRMSEFQSTGGKNAFFVYLEIEISRIFIADYFMKSVDILVNPVKNSWFDIIFRKFVSRLSLSNLSLSCRWRQLRMDNFHLRLV